MLTRGARRSRWILLLLSAVPVAALAGPSASAGWTPAMETRIVREASRLMPAALRRILETHDDELTAGLREAAGDETVPPHIEEPRGRNPGAAARVGVLSNEIVAMIDGHRPFGLVARRMGELAHFVCDLNNPLQVASEDPREYDYAADYAGYVESHLDRFPLVFYGWSDPALGLTGEVASADAVAFARSIARRSRAYYGPIRRAYAPDNKTPPAQRFDVRSLPFGVGSLSYSHAVTDTARIWMFVWKQAHGDLRGTPYLAREIESLRQERNGSPAPEKPGPPGQGKTESSPGEKEER